jgi:excisionase family DNA binding protein
MAIELLTVGELADLLRVSENRVLILVRRRELPSISIDGRIRFDAQEIEDWLKFKRVGEPPMKPPRELQT